MTYECIMAGCTNIVHKLGAKCERCKRHSSVKRQKHLCLLCKKEYVPMPHVICLSCATNQETFSPLNESVLKEADRLINGDRQAQYSHPSDDYAKTVGAFNALTGHKLTAKEGMLFMVCVKLSREAYKHKRDNLTDACGYLGCIEKHEDRLKESK